MDTLRSTMFFSFSEGNRYEKSCVNPNGDKNEKECTGHHQISDFDFKEKVIHPKENLVKWNFDKENPGVGWKDFKMAVCLLVTEEKRHREPLKHAVFFLHVT